MADIGHPAPTRSVTSRPMGLLDDAIREHLELKRRHGAATEEVRRLEHEALSPVRRRGEPPIPEPAEDEVGDDERPLADDDPSVDEPAADAGIPLDQPVMPEPAGYEPEPEQFPPGDEPAAVPAQEAGPAAVPVREPDDGEPEGKEPEADGVDEDELWLDESDEHAPPDDLLEPPGQETSAFSAADVAEATGEAPAPREEDVLEETPEFLQETPEHDRLWFEQRPPRRFDFDQ
jgi:hypothetical protein